MIRTLLAINYGVLNHTVFTAYALKAVPYMDILQDILSFSTFIVIDIILLISEENVKRDFDYKIEKLL